MNSWLDPALSLPSELEQERDRRNAVKLSLQELQVVADKLICDWYRHQTMLAQALRQVSILEVKLMLAEAKPAPREPSPDHLRMARELLGRE